MQFAFVHRRGQLVVCAIFLVVWLSGISDTLSQTKWFKYEGNPVLTSGPSGSWDVSTVMVSRVLLEKSVYKMWYSGRDGKNHLQIGYATSRDGIVWRKYEENPIVKIEPQQWDCAGLGHGYVTHSDGQYKMWYTGGNDVRSLQIGYATSADGIHWAKAGRKVNPVLRAGPPGSWKSQTVSGSCVIGPDSTGKFKMWFAGENEHNTGPEGDEHRIRFGYATGTDETAWSPMADPVFQSDRNGTWDDRYVCFPRVLFHDNVFEMWYTGCRSYPNRRVGYAVSADGISWNRAPDNPVLVPGPKGSWDGGLTIHPDILFDGRMYHMWYSGNADQQEEVGTWNIGYAISPPGTIVTVSPQVVQPGSPVRIDVRMDEHLPISLTGVLFSEEGKAVDTVSFFNDGKHGEGAADDGYFSNSWNARSESAYSIDLLLKCQGHAFRLRNAAAFSTVGPVLCTGMKVMNDETPHPGDTLAIKLVIRNQGREAAAREVRASLLPIEPFVALIDSLSLSFGNIAPDSSAESGYYLLAIRPDCPANKDVALNVSIASAGIPYWNSTVSLHVRPPWWRTGWAFVLYGFLLAGCAVSTVKIVSVRKLKRQIVQLERDRALERERMRISQDMHDEVGSRLTEIGILGELAKKDLRDPHKTEEEIEKITEASREVTASISEIIWAISARNDALENLVAYIREYTSKYLETAAIVYRFQIPDAVPDFQLSMEARRNIFLVVKETLNNIVKHSGATEVKIQMSFPSHRIEIVVEDNGHGFDANCSSRFGNGLKNMEKRMSDIEGSCEICSSPGKGTKVAISAKVGNGA